MQVKKEIENVGIARIFKEFEKMNDRLQNGLTPVSVATLKEYIIKLEEQNGLDRRIREESKAGNPEVEEEERLF